MMECLTPYEREYAEELSNYLSQKQQKSMIGAHNALSGYKPTRRWMRLFRFAYRCQNKTIEQLIGFGVTFFDIRVRFTKRCHWPCAAHGLASFNISVSSAVMLISRRVSNPTVRLILESGEKDKSEFIAYCRMVESTYPNIRFIGGNYKPTWEKLYTFKDDDIGDNITQYVGSMQTWWGKLCPWLYARLYNRKNLAKTCLRQSKLFLFDFL